MTDLAYADTIDTPAAAPAQMRPQAPDRLTDRPAPAVVRTRRRTGIDARQVLMFGALIAVTCWGAWVTKSIVAPPDSKGEFVKLQLQGVMTEYLQAQARSGSDDQTAAAATTRFMAELDKTIADIGKSGRVVLVNEAVIGGDIPDITQQVKQAVYSKVPMPRVAAATPVQQDMQAYLSANGTGQALAPGQAAAEPAAPAQAISPLNAMGALGGNAQ